MRLTRNSASDSEGFSRRNFVQAGVLGFGGLKLPQFLAGRSEAASRSGIRFDPTRAGSSVILMWMSGGPGHHETRDPKPEAVSQFRGPFVVNSNPNAADYRIRGLSLASNLTFDRLRDRRSLLSTFDAQRRELDLPMQDLDANYQSAFDINAEPATIRDTYSRHEFGQSALLARRLVKRGVAFVTVNTQPWNHHGTANRYATAEGAKLRVPPFDRALAALVRDLIDRGLYKKTVVVAMGEFGRLPRGIVVGSSDYHRANVAERPLFPEDVAATSYHHLGIDGQHTTFPDRSGRPVHLVETGEPIRELVGVT